MDEILKWIDSTPADLETRLKTMPETVMVEPPSKTPFLVRRADLIDALISLQGLATGISEEPEDYAKLSMLHLAKAKTDPQHYRKAIETLKKIPEHRLTPELLFQCAKTLFDAWEGTQCTAYLQEAYERATDFLSEEEKPTKQQHTYIGKIFAEKADNAPYSEKRELYEKAIRHLKQAITDEKDATGYHLLAEKQEEYMTDCPDLILKQQLLNEAITNYTTAYELTEDADTLDSIRELETERTYHD